MTDSIDLKWEQKTPTSMEEKDINRETVCMCTRKNPTCGGGNSVLSLILGQSNQTFFVCFPSDLTYTSLSIHLDRSLVLLAPNNCSQDIAKMAAEWRDLP